MAVTQNEILRFAIDQVPRRGVATKDGVSALASTGGDTGTLIDTSYAPPYGVSESNFRNWFLYRHASSGADRVRMIAQYDPVGMGYKIHEPLLSSAVAASEEYMVLRDHPDAWIRALNQALTTRCFTPTFDEFTPTSNTQRIYTVSAAPISITLGTLTELWGVQRHNANDASGEERWEDWPRAGSWINPYEDEGTYYIEFGGRRPGTADELRLVRLVPFSALTDAATTTSAVDKQWAAYETLLVMAQRYGDQNNADDEWSEIGRRILPLALQRRRQVLGKYAAQQVWRVHNIRGGVTVAGRGR